MKRLVLVLGLSLGGVASAASSVSDGPVSHQSLATSTDESSIGRTWTELASVPLNCLASPVLSADASLQVKSGAVRVRVVAQPFGEGEEFEVVVFEPASVLVAAGRDRPNASSFTFAGEIPSEVDVAFVSLEVRGAKRTTGVVSKASLRALWDARSPSCD